MFTPIDLSSWPRREHFHYYRNILPCGYAVTVSLDVTRLRAVCRERGLKFYPTFIWCVSHTILSHPAFRMGVDQDGNPGTHDVMHPNYTVFHEDDHTFSDLWTAHDEDFSAFYAQFLADGARYGDNHGIKARPGQPAPAGDNPFTDLSGEVRPVVWAVEAGITTGTSATTFSPDATCTRGQIVTFLYRTYAGG